MYALLSHWYQFKPWEIDRLDKDQMNSYIEQVPMLEYRRHYPMAQLRAQMANAKGGKKGGKGAKKIPDSQLYTPEEMLFRFAHYQPYIDRADQHGAPLGITPETAKIIISLNMHKENGKRASLLEPWMFGAFGSVWDEIVNKSGTD